MFTRCDCAKCGNKGVRVWELHGTFLILIINGLTFLLVAKLTFPLALVRGSQGAGPPW
jgi:hypothetical protein